MHEALHMHETLHKFPPELYTRDPHESPEEQAEKLGGFRKPAAATSGICGAAGDLRHQALALATATSPTSGLILAHHESYAT